MSSGLVYGTFRELTQLDWALGIYPTPKIKKPKKKPKWGGGADAGDMLVRAAAVTRQIPVYSLHIARDLAYMAQVAEQVVEWQSSSSTQATGTNG
jgi:hypothetical protein